jgi:hypothetical protein
MAGLDNRPLEPQRPTYDGQAMCRVCATNDADAEHDWCAASSALVCRSCCHRILMGHVALIVTEGFEALDQDVPESMEACARCERGRLWFAQHVAGLTSHGQATN